METDNPNSVQWRLRRLEEDVRELKGANVSVLAERVNNLAEDVKSLRAGFRNFAFGVVGGAIIFAFSVLALIGQ